MGRYTDRTDSEAPVTTEVEDNGTSSDGGKSSDSTKKTKASADAALSDAQALADQISSDPVKAINQFSNRLNKQQTRLISLEKALAEDPNNPDLQKAVEKTKTRITTLTDNLAIAQGFTQTDLLSNQQSMAAQVYEDPSSLVTKAQTPTVNTERGIVKKGTGKLTGDPTVDSTALADAINAQMGTSFDAATVEAFLASPQMQSVMTGVQAATGTVSPEALVNAVTQDPNTLSQLQLSAAQLESAQTVNAPDALTINQDEILSGSAVDWSKVQETLDIKAAQADPSIKATVQGQLDELMADFEDGNTPAWAAGALRKANAAMLERGLGASSMAGMAIVQAAMESAIPIASADAQTWATFELANLSNRQQVVMLAAQQRAEFLGQEFDQEFQSKVLNAQRISEIANINFTAEQQIALENAQMAQSVDLANLSARNAKIMADAAAMSQMDLANLNSRQQAAVQNAQSFLQMDLTNLQYEQQAELFKAEWLAQSILSDQAATNAAAQFNASSENQVNTFFSNMEAQVSQFNTSQQNAMSQFNASEENAMSRFNSDMLNQRDMFNAQNALVIAQANAQWRQTVQLTRFAAKQESNMQEAKEANALTAAALDQIWQREADLMDYAFRASESQADRIVQLMLGDMQLDAAREAASAQKSDNFWTTIGGLAGKLLFG